MRPGEHTCSVEGCEKKTRCMKGMGGEWCNAHYLRWKRHGDPLAGGTPRCRWISWDDDGRPSCEHGKAWKSGLHWVCRKKKLKHNYEARKERSATDRAWVERERDRTRKWLREKYATDPMFRLKKCQKGTLYNARKALERSIKRAELHY